MSHAFAPCGVTRATLREALHDDANPPVVSRLSALESRNIEAIGLFNLDLIDYNQ